MIRFTPEGFTIEVKDPRPRETWSEMVRDTVDALQSIDPELTNHNYFYLHELLKNMLPGAESISVSLENYED